MEGLVDSKIRLDSAYTASDWRLAAELVQKRAPDERPDTGPTLIITLLLSLALGRDLGGRRLFSCDLIAIAWFAQSVT
jgi:hypothetical protein